MVSGVSLKRSWCGGSKLFSRKSLTAFELPEVTKGNFMRALSFRKKIPVLLLLLSALGFSQTPQQKTTLVVDGYQGRVQVTQMNGKSYVEIESLARLTGGSVTFQTNQITLTLAAPAAIPAAAPTDPPVKLSKGFLQAGIEEMTVIGEWRIAVVNAVQNNNPVTDDGLDVYRRSADSKLAVASTTVVTDADRNVLVFLKNELGNTQKLSSHYLATRKSLTFIAPDSLDNDPLNLQIQNCAQGLASLIASGQFQDVATCH
jgi:hypothetical protein